jgi:nucleotide-binding universal stress UspA family protein
MTEQGSDAMIKDVIVNLTMDADRDMAADYAVSLAKALDAHLCGIGFAYEPYVPGSVFGGVAAELVQAQRAATSKSAQDAIARFDAAADRAGISAASHLFHSGQLDAVEMFGRLARRYDLSVVAQAEPDTSPTRGLIIEAALFGSGRPLMVVPYIQREPFKLDRVMVCWDGSRSAARAIGDAMPFIERAKVVEVVLVRGDPGKSDEIPGADIAHHLARHGRKVELQRIVVRDLDVTNTLLSHAADMGSDFMIMGGYGHSRLRELVLGGVTRGILQSMTVPTLMSH